MAPVSGESSSPTTSRLQHSRMTRKATASTTAIQPLEITTTAVVLSDLMRINTESLSSSTSLRHGMNTHLKETEPGEGYSRKPSLHHHTHHHSIKSSTCLTSGKAKKTRAAIMDFNVSPLNTFEDTPLEEAHLAFALPPPVIKSPSEAMTALQDATKDIKQKKGRPPCPPSREDLTQLFDSSFFSAVLLVQWSNVVGPKTEKVWSSEKMDEHLEKTIGRQILNGEMGRVLHREDVEAKWIVLHRQAIVCTGFLYNDEVVGSLCALVLVVPTRYLRNFSQYFGVLQEHVPNQLVKPLVLLRKAYKRHPGMTWPLALEYFTWRRLVPFVHSIMDLESVSLPTECIKISHTILDHESRQMLDSPFIAQ
ncbi:hypothetical protein BDF14DRAFT_1498784 [Spinellus fusiger]|nr:hypothetical protein BDF14DRAFT_1498784 [Spinellus fusiger]